MQVDAFLHEHSCQLPHICEGHMCSKLPRGSDNNKVGVTCLKWKPNTWLHRSGTTSKPLTTLDPDYYFSLTLFSITYQLFASWYPSATPADTPSLPRCRPTHKGLLPWHTRSALFSVLAQKIDNKWSQFCHVQSSGFKLDLPSKKSDIFYSLTPK